MENFEPCIDEEGQQVLDSEGRAVFYNTTNGSLMIAVEEIPNEIPNQQKKSLQENSDIQKAENSETWTKKKLMLLIERRLAMESLFQNPTCKKTKYWSQIQTVFEESGYSVTAADLAAKWKNLMVTYMRNVDKIKKTGESAITWEYFNIIHAKLGRKRNVCPPPASLGSTFAVEGSKNQSVSPTVSASLRVARNSPHEMSPSQMNPVPCHESNVSCIVTPKVSIADSEPIDAFVEGASTSRATTVQISKKGQKRSAQIQDLYILLRDKKNADLELKRTIWMEKKELTVKKLKTLDNLAAALKSLQKARYKSSSSETEDN